MNLDVTPAEQQLWHITTPDGQDRLFRRAILGRLPAKLAETAVAHYLKLYGEFGLREANLFLLGLQERLPPHALAIVSHDEDLCRLAKLKAEKCALMAAKHPVDEAYLILSKVANDYSLQPPGLSEKVTLAGAVNRLCDDRWWRTELRRTIGRNIEQVAIELGFVHKRAGIYVSDETLSRRRQQNARNKSILDSMVAVNELGDEFTLSALAALSVSNPELRRNELMTRIAGFELVSQRRGDVAVMYTITCPSRMHARYLSSGDPVPNYDGTTPRQANEYLGKVWSRIRAELARKGIKLYGMRVAEPMHDGTPHVHFLVFMPSEISEKVEKTFRKYALQEDGDEAGAQKYRFNVQNIDPEKGTATGYIAKYISKNIDGHGLDCDLYGREAASSSERVQAWASRWGIRQFQQVGGAPVSIWRELRRLPPQSNEVLEKIRQAADAADWAAYTELMGGPTVERKNLPIKLAHVFNEKPGRYGEPLGDQVFGLDIDGATVMRHGYTWDISWKQVETEAGMVIKRYAELDRNCTQILESSETGLEPVPGISESFGTGSEKVSKRAETGFETGVTGFGTSSETNGLIPGPGPGGSETSSGQMSEISELFSEKRARSATDHLEFCQ